MSWQDRDKLDLKITTGDGIEYTVSWLTASQKTKWHGSDTSFIDLPDVLVKKRKRQGRVFPLEFYFHGDNHLEDSARFRASLDSENPCTIEHPYYNTIIAHIMELDIDNSALNVSKCTCLAIETMVGESAIISDRIDVVLLKKVEIDDLIQEAPEINPSIEEIDRVKGTTEKNHRIASTIIKLQSAAQEYTNAYQTTLTRINAFTSAPILAMQALNNLLTMPAQFDAAVMDRLRILREQFDILRGTITGLFSPVSKTLYVMQQATILSTMCKSAVTPLVNDYRNATVATRAAQGILEAYELYRNDVDSLQSENNGSPLSFMPDFNITIKLEEAIYLTVSGLYVIALSGRKQRTFQLTEDSNVILLTHMLYRLDPNDENMTELIENNNLTYQEIALGIEKGRTLTYYI